MRRGRYDRAIKHGPSAETGPTLRPALFRGDARPRHHCRALYQRLHPCLRQRGPHQLRNPLGESRPVVSRPGQMTALTPALVRPAPTNPPISACELLDGMPAHRVMRFKRIAHLWSVFGGHDSISRVLSANARLWSQSLTRQHVPMFHEGTNNLSQIGLTHASGSLSGRMPLGPPLALFGPSLELTRYAQRKHTDLHRTVAPDPKILSYQYEPIVLFSDHAGFFKGFLQVCHSSSVPLI